jgi:hypothetical protein
MEERLTREVSPAEAVLLWTSTYILMGLRHPSGLAAQLLSGVSAMKESATCQAILDEGRAEGEKKVLLLVGSKRFGPPDARTRAAPEAVDSVERLERLSERVLEVGSWEELLASP